MKTRLSCLVLLALAVAPAFAQTPVDETRPASVTATVSIETISGTVRVFGWDRPEVKVTGTLGKGVEALEVEGSLDRITIEVRYPSHSVRDAGGADLEIRVPRGGSVEVETVSSSVDVEDVEGRLSLQNVSGTITVKGEPREVEATVVSGTIRVMLAAPLALGEFETVSGNIEMDGDVAPNGRLDFQAVSGNIRLRLPASVSAEIDASSFSGGISNDFGAEVKKTSEYLPSKEMSFTAGRGGARIELETLSGKIEISKK